MVRLKKAALEAGKNLKIISFDKALGTQYGNYVDISNE